MSKKRIIQPDLPDLDVIAEAVIKVGGHNEGKTPKSTDKGYEPAGWPQSWASLIRVLKREHDLTIPQMMVREGHWKEKPSAAELPNDHEIITAVLSFMTTHGRSPKTGDRGLEPEGWPNGWGSLIHRLRQDRDTNISEILVKEGFEADPRIAGRIKLEIKAKNNSKKNAPTVVAHDVFNGVVRFIRHRKRIPKANTIDRIAGYSGIDIQRAFGKSRVTGLSLMKHFQDIAPEQYPKTFKDFMTSTGLAIQSPYNSKVLVPTLDLPDLICTKQISEDLSLIAK